MTLPHRWYGHVAFCSILRFTPCRPLHHLMLISHQQTSENMQQFPCQDSSTNENSCIWNKTAQALFLFFFLLLIISVLADADILTLLLPAKRRSKQTATKYPHPVWKTLTENWTAHIFSFPFFFKSTNNNENWREKKTDSTLKSEKFQEIRGVGTVGKKKESQLQSSSLWKLQKLRLETHNCVKVMLTFYSYKSKGVAGK